MARRIIEYKTCPPSTYRTEELLLLYKKFEVIEEHIHDMEFHKTLYDKDGRITGEEEFKIIPTSKVEEITVNLDTDIEEFYVQTTYLEEDLHIEVVTKEVAEANDKDFLRSEYYELINNGGYEVGDDNSYYTQIADTDFYYREL